MNEFTEVAEDLAAFADEESDAAVDSDGSFIIQRNGAELSGVFRRDAGGALLVDIDGTTITYRRFLTHTLARLDILAQRLSERRTGVKGFIDAPVTLQRAAEDISTGLALDVLHRQCKDLPPFASRVTFITADAGHGKTALLREHQYVQAQRFLRNESHYLFWHLDLQGRQLLRLSEALMGDLAELRLAGLWMPAVVRLMRHGALVIGIDGFDELAAEQGGSDALGALASLVSQLRGQGAVVAASRRTFFDTDDYLRRGGIIRRGVPDPCQFDQVELQPWTGDEVRQYLGKVRVDGRTVHDADQMYGDMVAALGGDAQHPLVTRPFLVTQIARATLLYGVSPNEFLRAPDDPYSGVAAVVEAFVKREVSEKWKVRETGEPYLSEEQHLQLLSDVAEEMHRSQKDRLSLDIIETLTALLLDQWKIDTGLRQQMIEMVRMHVLLVAPPDGGATYRSFDHPEFRDYFIAYALRARLEKVMQGHPTHELGRFLSISQLSDSTARYACSMLDRTQDSVQTFLAAMEEYLTAEWKPTYLQLNLGTLIPFMVNNADFSETVHFGGGVVYSSLALENTTISNVTLSNGTFVNASLRGIDWRGVKLENFALGELQLDSHSRLESVELSNCKVDGVRLQIEDGEEAREYAPQRIDQILRNVGFTFNTEQLPIDGLLPPEDALEVKLLRKLLRMFNRTTIVSDESLRIRFGNDAITLESLVIPFLVDRKVLTPRKWRGSGNHNAWTLGVGLDDLLAAEGNDTALGQVWSDIAAQR